MPYFTEHIIKVYGDVEEAFIEVGPDTDVPGIIVLSTNSPGSQEYYGKVRLALMPKLARLLGEALIKMANEYEK